MEKERRPFRGCSPPETLPRAQNPGSGLQGRLFQGLPVIKVIKPFTNPITHVLKLGALQAGLSGLNPELRALQVINAGEGVEKREHSCTVCGNVN